MVDTPLLLTISQASATFVAILAGFYTTKVLSISNERKRLHSVTKAIDNEIRSRNQTVTQLTTQIDSIHNRWDEEWIESFVDYIRNAPIFISMNKIDTLEDIKQRFEDLYKQPPSENHLKILREKYPSLLKDFQKTKGMTFKLGPYPSEPEQLRKVLQDTDETRMMTELYERVNREKNQISFLEGSKRMQEEDLKSLSYPKYVEFGYASFVIFAILGVIFPLTYRWWPSYLSNNSEVSGLSAFVVGLVLTLLYIGLELRNALSNDTSHGATLNKSAMLMRLKKWLRAKNQ